MSALPTYKATRIHDDDQDPCEGCPLRDVDEKCVRVPLRRYDREGHLSEPDDPIDLLVIGDVPTKHDNRKGGYLRDEDGKNVLDAIKELGVNSFAIIPAVRCYPLGQVDHFTSNAPWDNQETALDRAREAVEHCKDYVIRARASYQPKVTLALGSVATEALGMGSNVIKLRSKPIYPNPGLAAASRTEGTVVTWDRAYGRVNKWAATEMMLDIEEKLPHLMETGYATPRGDERTVEQVWLTTVEDVRAFVEECLTSPDIPPDDVLAFDFETMSMERSKTKNRILNVGFAFTSQEDYSYVIPLQHPETPFSADELEQVFAELGRLWQAEGAPFYGFLAHNAQFETEMIKVFWDLWVGEKGGKPILDTLILAYLANENRHKKGINKPYALETLALEYLGFRWYTETGIKTRRDRLAEEPLDRVNRYVGYDAAVTARLFNQLIEWMDEEKSDEDLLRVAAKLYGPATIYTSDMTLVGQRIDVDLLRLLRAPDSEIVSRVKHIKKVFAEAPQVKKALQKIQAKSGKSVHGLKARFTTSSASRASEFNMNSPEHLKALFWDVMKLRGANKSVDKMWQNKHRDRHELVALFQEYQQLSKLDQAYLSPIAEFIQRSDDGRLHPSFNLAKTVSGRLSASEPNTQQVPRSDTKAKKQIKSLYAAPEGKIMVQLDFSQAEVRWLGILSGDDNLAEKYATAEKLKDELLRNPSDKEVQRALLLKGDLHMSTAIDMYKLDEDECLDGDGERTKYAKDKRQNAKAVCFGLIYGKHFKSLARDLGIEEKEAKEAVEKWMGQFPQAAAWLEMIDETIGDTCVSRSPFGRWRRLAEAASDDASVANRAKRQARNTPIQSAASDFCIYAACKLRDALRAHPDPKLREETLLINTVHDSLIAEMPAEADVLREYARVSKDIFIDPTLIERDFGVVTNVPLAVDFEVGLNWGNMHDYNLTEESLKECLYDAEVLRAHPAGTVFSDLKGKGLLYAEVRS